MMNSAAMALTLPGVGIDQIVNIETNLACCSTNKANTRGRAL